MKKIIILTCTLISTSVFAERGPYFPSPDKAPVNHGKIIFNSPELNLISAEVYVGEVVVQKYTGGFEVAPMIYQCSMNEDDGAYGSLGCRYLRYDLKKAKHFNECEVFDNDYYNCY